MHGMVRADHSLDLTLPYLTLLADYSLQADGTRRSDNKAVRAAVDAFARRVGRQVQVAFAFTDAIRAASAFPTLPVLTLGVQVAYRDPQRAFMWNAWVMRR